MGLLSSTDSGKTKILIAVFVVNGFSCVRSCKQPPFPLSPLFFLAVLPAIANNDLE